MTDRYRAAAIAGAPALATLAAAPFTKAGAAGVFQADLVGLVTIVAVAAFLVRPKRNELLAVLGAALALGLAHVLAGGAFARAPALMLLALAVATAASGLAAVGRALGTPTLTAGGAAAAVLWIAMTGLLWADDMAEALPRAERVGFKQAVLHLDAATACAYDAADYDRFHDPDIYRDVKLATSIVRAPEAATTALAWLLFGAVAWGAAVALGARRPTQA